MEVNAKLRNMRLSPKKMRLVTNVIKGLRVEEAERQLLFLQKKGARPLLKLLRSAIANAENNFRLKKEELFVKSALVNQGVTLHRWTPRAFGRAAPIQKKTSMVSIVLQDKHRTESNLKKSDIQKPEPSKKQP